MAVENVLTTPKDNTDAAAPKTTNRIEIQKVTAFGGVNFMSFSLILFPKPTRQAKYAHLIIIQPTTRG